MPIYVYKCPTCEGITEELTSVGNMRETIQCINCDYLAFRIVTSPASIKMAPRKKWRGGEGAIHSHDFDADYHRIAGSGDRMI